MYNMLILIVSFCVTFLVIKFLENNAKKIKLIDNPGDRKIHNDAVPVIGGPSIFIVFSFICLYYIFIIDSIILSEIIYLIISTSIIFILGLYDDIIGLRTSKKIFFQLIAALLFIFGLGLDQYILFDLIDFYYVNFLFLVLFIIGITNSINLIDGIDHLAGGISIISIISFISLNLFLGLQFQANYLLFALLGSLFSFMIYNGFKSKIFLGDSGSLFLGWLFSLISLFFIKNVNVTSSIFLPLIILGVPAFDVLFVMKERFLSSGGYKTIFNPDNRHIHHLFIESGYSNDKTYFILCILSAIFSILAIFSLYNIESVNYYIVVLISILIMLFLRYILRKNN